MWVLEYLWKHQGMLASRVGRGLQSTVNDAEAHHLDNGPQHGVLALK